MVSDPDQSPPDVFAQASYWVIVLYTFEDPTPFLDDYATWLNTSVENQRVYLLMEWIWRAMEESNLEGRLTPAILEPAAVCQPAPRNLMQQPWMRSIIGVGALAFAGTLLAPHLFSGPVESHLESIGVSLHLVHCPVSPPETCRARPGHPEFPCPLFEGQHASDYGHTPVLDLADGSEVVLNANSQVTLDITSDHRRVRLDRGQAQFNVSKNERVPFEVPVDSTVVEAVGTVFTVAKRARGASEVVVEEGRVLVHAQERDPGFPLGEGQTADVEQGRVQVRPTESSQLDARASWVAGVVELRSTKLSEAAERFNPYNRRQLVVDPDIADLHVDGIFAASDPDGFAAALEQLRGIHRSFSRDPETGAEIIRLSKQALPGGSPHMTGDGKRLADPH